MYTYYYEVMSITSQLSEPDTIFLTVTVKFHLKSEVANSLSCLPIL